MGSQSKNTPMLHQLLQAGPRPEAPPHFPNGRPPEPWPPAPPNWPPRQEAPPVQVNGPVDMLKGARGPNGELAPPSPHTGKGAPYYNHHLPRQNAPSPNPLQPSFAGMKAVSNGPFAPPPWPSENHYLGQNGGAEGSNSRDSIESSSLSEVKSEGATETRNASRLSEAAQGPGTPHRAPQKNGNARMQDESSLPATPGNSGMSPSCSSVHDEPNDAESSMSSPSWPRTPISPANAPQRPVCSTASGCTAPPPPPHGYPTMRPMMAPGGLSPAHFPPGAAGPPPTGYHMGPPHMPWPGGPAPGGGSQPQAPPPPPQSVPSQSPATPGNREAGPALVARLMGEQHNCNPQEWREREMFYTKLVNFSSQHGHPLTGQPTVSKTPMDLFQLYREVRSRGGFEEVTKAKKWKEVGGVVAKLPSTSSASYQLRNHYKRYLLPYECQETGRLLAEVVGRTESKRQKKPASATKAPRVATPPKPTPQPQQQPGPPGFAHLEGYNQQGVAPQGFEAPPHHHMAPRPPPGPQYQHGMYPGYASQQQGPPRPHGLPPAGPPGPAPPPPSSDAGADLVARDPFDDRGRVPVYAPMPYQRAPGAPPPEYYRFQQPQGQPPAPPPSAPPTSAAAAPPPPVSSAPPPPVSAANGPPAQPPDKYSVAGQPERFSGPASEQQQDIQRTGHPYPEGYPSQPKPQPVAAGQQLPPSSFAPPRAPLPPGYGYVPRPPKAWAPPPPGQQPWPPMQPPPMMVEHAKHYHRPYPPKPFVPPDQQHAPPPMPPHPGSMAAAHRLRSDLSAHAMAQVTFPPNSVEMTQPNLARRQKITHKDTGRVEAWRLVMALKSGLLVETAWALNLLTVLLYDDATVPFFGLQHLPALLNELVTCFRESLEDVFGREPFAGFPLRPAAAAAAQLAQGTAPEQQQQGPSPPLPAETSRVTSSAMVKVLPTRVAANRRRARTGPPPPSVISTRTLPVVDIRTDPDSTRLRDNAREGPLRLHPPDPASPPQGKRGRGSPSPPPPAKRARDCPFFYRQTAGPSSWWGGEEVRAKQNLPLNVLTERRRESLERAKCVSNVLRGLSFISLNDKILAKQAELLWLLGKLLLLKHDHRSRARGGATTDATWWWDGLDGLRDDAFVALCNVSASLDLAAHDAPVVEALCDGLLHWVVCPSAYAQDPLETGLQPTAPPPPGGPVAQLSPERYALEILTKLSVLDGNVDLILATPPYARQEALLERLVGKFGPQTENPLREFALVLLSALAAGSDVAASYLALETQAIDLLVVFLEAADSSMHQVVLQQGMTALRENPELMGTSVGMLRRAANALSLVARLPACRPRFARHQQRLLNVTMSQLMDSRVAATIAEVLFEFQRQPRRPPAPRRPLADTPFGRPSSETERRPPPPPPETEPPRRSPSDDEKRQPPKMDLVMTEPVSPPHVSACN